MKLVDDLKSRKMKFEEGLKEFQNKRIENAFQDPNIPLLNSSRAGTTDACYKPTWYTKIHDLLETFMEYSKEDIKNERFAELKIALLPQGLRLSLFDFSPMRNYSSGSPILTLIIPVEVIDIERGTFQFPQNINYSFSPYLYF